MLKMLFVGVLLVAGCNEPAGPFGAHRLYQLTAEHVPTTPVASAGYSLDIDGDRQRENQLGDALEILMHYGLGDVQNATDQAVAAGAVELVIDVQTNAHGDSLVNTYVGSADAYDPTSPAQPPIHGTADGPLVNAYTGDLPAVIAPFGVATPVVLHGAHVDLFAGPDSLDAIIAGGIDPDIVSGTLIAQWHDVVQAIVVRDCSGMAPNCSCAPGSPGATAITNFDLDRSCTISVDELANGSLVPSLVMPYTKIDGQLVISFGFGIDAVRVAD